MTDQPTHHYSRTRDESGERVHIDGRPVPRFEIVHKPRRESEPYDSMVTPTEEPNPQPWHVRVIGGNGEPLMSTETYVDEASAYDVIVAVARIFGVDEPTTYTSDPDSGRVLTGYVEGSTLVVPILRVEVKA